MIQINTAEKQQHKKLFVTWGITFLILFPLLITLGLLMRIKQGEIVDISMSKFYSFMTLHGLGMAGVLFSIALASLFYLLGTRYTNLNVRLGYYVFYGVVIGVVGLVIGTLIGEFGAGWYMLYPLPFKGAYWTDWSLGVTFFSILILGISWLILCLHILFAVAKQYGGFSNIIGWQYFSKSEPKEDLPAIILITTVSVLASVFAVLAGAVMDLLFILQYFEPSLSLDPLMMKNIIFFFGHTIVNATMYIGIAWLYAILPEFTHRDWKVTKLVVIAWNATFFFILFAYFHHLYMDFVQPLTLQYLGQFASYFSSIPATAVTMFGVIGQFYRSKVRWSIVPTMFLLGVAGWAIGGFAAVVDSTIAINRALHNTLWVPAHFHTYMLMGIVLIIFAFLYYFSTGENTENDIKPGWDFKLFVTGSYGFLLMFYLGGLYSIPRRFSDYAGVNTQSVHETGSLLAKIAVVFIVLLLIGLLSMYGGLIKRLLNNLKE
jgi:cytochrome c oxidase subunit 1